MNFPRQLIVDHIPSVLPSRRAFVLPLCPLNFLFFSFSKFDIIRPDRSKRDIFIRSAWLKLIASFAVLTARVDELTVMLLESFSSE